MTAFPLEAFLAGLALATGGVAVLLAATFAAAVALHRHSVIDVTWGLGFVVAASLAYTASAGYGDDGRRLLLLVLTLAWGARLAGFIGWRARGAGEDPRYVDMLADAPGSRNVYALRKVYLPQALVMLFVSLPLQVGMFATSPLGWVAVAGVLFWLVGFVFETVGDWQLAAFRRGRAEGSIERTILDTGLWRYTRHPNYFGDAMVWVGLFLVCADSWPGVLTVLSPALMFWTLAHKTGKPLTEQRMESRPGYREYLQNTSGFFPLPPKPGRGARVSLRRPRG